jgi:hypothetical protein
MGAGEESRWTEMIKTVRQRHGVGIFEAEKLPWEEPQWRRWVERQINRDPKCRKMALHHMRSHGGASLVLEQDGRLVVRRP